jgi:predicted RNA-binding protein with PIN domain
MGKGASRMSVNDLKEEILRVNEIIRDDFLEKINHGKAYIGEKFKDDVRGYMEEDK